MREAGALAPQDRRRPFKHWTKGEDRSPVSEADIAVNDLLHERLTALAPDAGWLSEETEDDRARLDAARCLDRRSDRRHARLHRRPRRLDHLGRTGRRRPPACRRALRAGDAKKSFSRSRGGGATCNGAPIKASDGDGLRRRASIAGPKRYLDRLSRPSPEARLPSRTSIRSRCGSRAWRRGTRRRLRLAAAATTGTLRQPIFWCTKPAAR